MSRDLPTQSPQDKRPVSVEDTKTMLSWLKELTHQIQLVWRLFWDPRVPWPTKILPPAVLAYVIFPIDIIPDLALGLGQLDDVAVILLGLKLFIELAPAEVVREHLKSLGAKIAEWGEEEEEIIEAEFEVEDAPGTD